MQVISSRLWRLPKGALITKDFPDMFSKVSEVLLSLVS